MHAGTHTHTHTHTQTHTHTYIYIYLYSHIYLHKEPYLGVNASVDGDAVDVRRIFQPRALEQQVPRVQRPDLAKLRAVSAEAAAVGCSMFRTSRVKEHKAMRVRKQPTPMV
jgi:hypothetical protein